MTQTGKQASYGSAFLAIVFTFFFWGFVAASNGVLIPMLKENFHLTQFESQLVDSAFYAAYFVGSLIYFFISIGFGDPINKIGYKKGLIIGLVVSAFGAAMFVPAVNAVSYPILLSGLFIIGLGFALLQIVANPFVINLGDPKKGSNRLNLAGGINSLGTTVGPVLLAYALFGTANAGTKVASLDSLKTPYVGLAIVLMALALLTAVVKMPNINNEEKLDEETLSPTVHKDRGIFQYPQLIFGMLAIFVYVGTEVTIQSNLSALLKLPNIKGIDSSHAAMFVSLYWGSLMIGRMSSSLRTFKLSDTAYSILSIIVPFAVFGIVLLVNVLRGSDISDLWIYPIWIVLFIIVKFLGQEKPSRTLLLFGITAMLLMMVGLFTNGNIALFSFVSGGLFCSVMWPCIFALAIAGLGKHTNQGSSLLVMMILGGAVIPPIQGALADSPTVGIHFSYWVPFVGFAYLAWYGFAARRMLQKQGIDYDATVDAGH
jgi:MFS transporter, FHS family, L-fucose permease